MNVKENLIAARAKIADIKNWGVGRYAQDASGHPVASSSERAFKYCGVGALLAVWPPAPKNDNLFADSLRALIASAETLYSNDNVGTVNDTLGHEAILKVYDHAINNASEE